jgi:type IV secretory pathway TraG/TraD family ATPase VirD4
MARTEVFDGNKLNDKVVAYDCDSPKCKFEGTIKYKDRANNEFTEKATVPFDEELLSRHMMFLGGIGTGKTNAFIQIVGQLIKSMSDNQNKDDVMIIFDTKGDFYKAFKDKTPNGHVVISNDETATGVNGADYWNIFNEIQTDEHMKENIIEISKSLFYEKIQRTQQPFFPNAAKDLFGAILTLFLRVRPLEKRNNQTLKEFFDTAITSQYREILMKKGNEDLRAFVNYISKDDSGQTQGVISELQQVTKSIFIGNFEKAGTLSMRNLVREKGGKVIFVEYDIGVGATLSPIYSLLYDLAIKEALCRKEGTRGNVYFIADEFRLLPNLQHIDDAVNFGRSLGVKFMIGIQNVEQIYECYGEQRARSIMSGFLTSVAFRVNDVISRQHIKDLHGQNRKREIYTSTVANRGTVENLRDGYVVEDWDVSNLERGEAIIGLPDKEPFKFKFKKVL